MHYYLCLFCHLTSVNEAVGVVKDHKKVFPCHQGSHRFQHVTRKLPLQRRVTNVNDKYLQQIPTLSYIGIDTPYGIWDCIGIWDIYHHSMISPQFTFTLLA